MKGETDGVVAAVAGGRRRGRERNEEEGWRGRASDERVEGWREHENKGKRSEMCVCMH